MSKIFPMNWKPMAWLSILIVTAVACSNPKEFPKQEKRDEIHFGQGGGFTGAVSHYILLEDGRLFQKGWQDSTLTYIDTWPGLFTRQMFLNYKSLRLDTINVNKPGNLYYFLEYHSRKNPTHRIVWGNAEYQPDDNLVTYYSTLQKMIKPNS